MPTRLVFFGENGDMGTFADDELENDH